MRVVELQKEIRDIGILRKLDLIETMIGYLKKDLFKKQSLAKYDDAYISIIADKMIGVLRKIFYLLDVEIDT